jgi:hypothetical protein
MKINSKEWEKLKEIRKKHGDFALYNAFSDGCVNFGELIDLVEEQEQRLSLYRDIAKEFSELTEAQHERDRTHKLYEQRSEEYLKVVAERDLAIGQCNSIKTAQLRAGARAQNAEARVKELESLLQETGDIIRLKACGYPTQKTRHDLADLSIRVDQILNKKDK